MNTINKEKLIEIVKKYECIYVQRHKDYKNIAYKTLLWEKIGATLGIEDGAPPHADGAFPHTWIGRRGNIEYPVCSPNFKPTDFFLWTPQGQDAPNQGQGCTKPGTIDLFRDICESLGGKAKELWRSLRDGYMRHKRTVRGQKDGSRKYLHYTWSSQMAFLDGTLELRPTSTNMTSQQADFDPLRTTSSSPVPPSPLEPLGSSQFYPDPEVDDDSSLSEMQDFTFTQSHKSPTRPQSLPSPVIRTPRSVTKREKKDSGRGEETDKILNYLRNKKRKQWDSVDHLFMSYAKSFKQLTLQNQAKLKVTLAKLFARAELENNLTDEPPNRSSPLIYSSPAYSEASNPSAESIND